MRLDANTVISMRWAHGGRNIKRVFGTDCGGHHPRGIPSSETAAM